MNDYRQYYDRNYLAAFDFEEGKDYPVTIEKFGRKRIGKDEKMMLVLKYKEHEKAHAIPKRDVGKVIAKVLGSNDPEDWIGKTVTLYVQPGSWFGGEVTQALRVRPNK